MKVMKFGGGCLKDLKSIAQAADIIVREKARPAVVVSAVSGVTDLLLETVHRAERSEREIRPGLDKTRSLHRTLAETMIMGQKTRGYTLRSMDAALHKLEKLLYGISYTAEATPAARAAAASFGERLASFLLAGVLTDRGCQALPLESDKIGMVTDDVVENATVDLRAFKRNLAAVLKSAACRAAVPVFTGYFGVTPRGRVALFGRNGTDYSAAAVAFALGADRLEIWKDVPGFMSADPKFVPKARKISRLSYYEAAELSYFGAKILHPRTLEPLRGRKVSVVIKSLWDPDGPGTEVQPNGSVRKDVVKSVTSNANLALLRIHGPGGGYKPGIIGLIGRKLADRSINIFSIITSQTCINLLVDRREAGRSLAALKSERGGVIERVDLEEDIVLVAAVGEGLLRSKGLAARIFSSVSRAGINVEMISSGASEVATYFIVAGRDQDKAVRALHREFFEPH